MLTEVLRHANYADDASYVSFLSFLRRFARFRSAGETLPAERK